MSGTSLDGVDAAMILTDGVTVKEFGNSGYRAYTDEERAVLRAGFGKTHGDEVDAAAAWLKPRISSCWKTSPKPS